MEAVGSELNLFEMFMNKTAVIGEMVQEFAPLATIIQGAPYEFQIEGSGKNYIDLNDSKLEVRVKLTTPTGADIAETVNVSTVNLPLHSLFQSVTMKIADKVVTESNNLNPYRSLMETLLNYEAEVMKTRLKCEGFEEDVSLALTYPTGAYRASRHRRSSSSHRRWCGGVDVSTRISPTRRSSSHLASSSMWNRYLRDRHSSSTFQQVSRCAISSSTTTTS